MHELLSAVAETNEQVRRAQQVRELIGSVSVSYCSSDGAVQVTVDADGSLTDLVFGDRARGIPPVHLGRLVMQCVQRARREIGARVEQIVHSTGPSDEHAARLISGYRAKHPDRFAETSSSPSIPPAARQPITQQAVQQRRPRPAPSETEEDFSEGLRIMQRGYRNLR